MPPSRFNNFTTHGVGIGLRIPILNSLGALNT
jgi:hypothetical protein